jgi:phospholipid transport system transporter-binding protein
MIKRPPNRAAFFMRHLMSDMLTGMTYALPASITLANAADCSAQLISAVRGGERSVDASGLTQCDSSAVAVLLAARRASDAPIEVRQPPAMLLSLATLYGVAELLDLPAQSASTARHHP